MEKQYLAARDAKTALKVSLGIFSKQNSDLQEIESKVFFFCQFFFYCFYSIHNLTKSICIKIIDAELEEIELALADVAGMKEKLAEINRLNNEIYPNTDVCKHMLSLRKMY